MLHRIVIPVVALLLVACDLDEFVEVDDVSAADVGPELEVERSDAGEGEDDDGEGEGGDAGGEGGEPEDPTTEETETGDGEGAWCCDCGAAPPTQCWPSGGLACEEPAFGCDGDPGLYPSACLTFMCS